MALVMAVAMLPPLSGGPSHDPLDLKQVEAARHMALDADSLDGQDHVHDDGSLEERQRGHSHGHSPADHSHETAGPAITLIAPDDFEAPAWRAHRGARHASVLSSRLERPPRSILRS
jgi:hypothetical protein